MVGLRGAISAGQLADYAIGFRAKYFA